MEQRLDQKTVDQSNHKKVGSPLIPIFVKCPHCGEELMDKEIRLDALPAIHLTIHNFKEKGSIWLSAQYGSFITIEEILIKDGEEVSFLCPFCDKELPIRRQCELCQAALLSLTLTSGGAIEFCSRKGCRNHHLEFQNIADLTHFYDMLYLDFSPAP